MKKGIIAVALILGAALLYAGTVLPVPKSITGALSGPDIPYEYIRFGGGHGMRIWRPVSPLTTATTTVCAIQSPAATSTLVRAGVIYTTSTSTASRTYLAKAATPYATTTSLGVGNLAANVKGTILASTTPTEFSEDNVDHTLVFSPNQYFVVGMAGGIGTFSPVGRCFAVFEEPVQD